MFYRFIFYPLCLSLFFIAFSFPQMTQKAYAEITSDSISFGSQKAQERIAEDLLKEQEKLAKQEKEAFAKQLAGLDEEEKPSIKLAKDSDALNELDDILGDSSASKSKERKVKKLLGERSTVNGVSGRWLPPKVWEQDVDNNAAANALRKKDTRVLSKDAQGINRAPMRAWE